MRRIKLIFGAITLSACSAGEIAEMESDKVDKMNLSASERVIAEALVEGYKKETGAPMLRSRDYAHAACYAKNVKMPTHFARVHAQYLKDYSSVDRDFYGWFRRQGVSDDAAYKFYSYVVKGFEACLLARLTGKAPHRPLIGVDAKTRKIALTILVLDP